VTEPAARGRPSTTASGESSSRYAQLLACIQAEFPTFTIVDKSVGWQCRLIDIALRVVTLGAQRRFLTHYHTVLGTTLYVPSTWPRATEVDRMIILRHERVHLRQRKRWGAWAMAFLYLVPFFPLGLAYGRARLEWEAYTETLRATAEYLGLEALRSPALRTTIVNRFTGGDYGWMWPFRTQVERWYDQVVRESEQTASLV
jgi:hypothetical protein